MPAPALSPSSDAVLRALFGVFAGLFAALILGLEEERRGLRWLDPRRLVLRLAIREMRVMLRGIEGMAAGGRRMGVIRAVAIPSPPPSSTRVGAGEVRAGYPADQGFHAAFCEFPRPRRAPLGRAPPRDRVAGVMELRVSARPYCFDIVIYSVVTGTSLIRLPATARATPPALSASASAPYTSRRQPCKAGTSGSSSVARRSMSSLLATSLVAT